MLALGCSRKRVGGSPCRCMQGAWKLLPLYSASSEALPASDVWKGSWKFEIDRRDNPMLAYYDTRGRTIFRIYCGTHFEMDAVYPGAAPKEDTTGSITIANGKTQMDFAGYVL